MMFSQEVGRPPVVAAETGAYMDPAAARHLHQRHLCIVGRNEAIPSRYRPAPDLSLLGPG